MNNNRLAVLLQISKSVYGSPLTILPSLLTRMQFNGDSQYKIDDYLIDCNCDVLPLSLDDLLNYTTLMLKFCTIKPIWALLLRQGFLGEGKGGVSPKKRV
jgi:hypothetical protein